MLKMCSWNIAHRDDPWRALSMSQYDVALLQESGAPPPDLSPAPMSGGSPWQIPGVYHARSWRSAVVGLSGDLDITWFPTASYPDATANQIPVSRPGTIDYAEVRSRDGTSLVLVSMYAAWEKPVVKSGWIYADASVHRLVSDICFFVGTQASHRIIAAGDLNILHAYGEDGSAYWKRRYQSVFDRLEAIGLEFVGPQSPNGHPPTTVREELPNDSTDVPAFRTKDTDASTATRQLDFVFASRTIAPRVQTRALNAPEEWGPSDHCIVEIDVDL